MEPMDAIVMDEALAEELDETHARKSWWLNLREDAVQRVPAASLAEAEW